MYFYTFTKRRVNIQLFIPLTEQVTDKLLNELSLRILRKWEDVAYRLGFDSYNIDEVKDGKSNGSGREKALAMLKQWKQSNGKGRGATKMMLTAALSEASLSELADFVLNFGN